MKIIFLFIILIALSYFYSCKSTENNSTQTTTGSPPEAGRYDFYMYDSTGNLLLNGVIDIRTHPENKLSGTYTFSNVFNNDFGGYHSMDGEFEGDFNPVEKRIFINTNPRIADANVFLYLNYTRFSMTGTWKFSTFRGAADRQGTFNAYKRSN